MAVTLSPDLRAYIDLTIYDRSATDLAITALTDAATKMPGVILREGMYEAVIPETMAYIAGEVITAVNRTPNATTQGLVNLFGVVRNLGTPPTVDVQFTLTAPAAAPFLIPVGAEVLLDLGVGTSLLFATDDNLTIGTGLTTGTVSATGGVNTVVANGLASGAALQLRSPISSVASVATASAVTGGAEAETDQQWLSRAVTRFGALTESVTKPSYYEAIALGQPGVWRARGVNRWNPNAGSGVPGDHGGYMTVAVLGRDGVALSAGAKATIKDLLREKGAADLIVEVIDAALTTVPVTITVARKTSATAAEVEANVLAALGDYLDPDRWPWAGTVYRNELIALVDSVIGVERVVSITAPAADVVLTGVAPLATAGALAVTVVSP